ncbi:MAG: endonuclease VIII [Syntrophomonadaceae bacterium]|nr:endonuclease VIII [Syntrophomonadaceae bacterium]MDD3023409.1 endonuclease VIII [Syntrophomonadaceae bacterium]
MLEIPEALTIACQINNSLRGKRIKQVITGFSPHKFAWYYGDPQNFDELLIGKTISGADAYGGLLEIKVESTGILFGDGVGLRFHDKDTKRVPKHQLLIEFEDDSALSASVQMYGGLGAFTEGELDNPYYIVAREKPSPLSNQFDESYFKQLISLPEVQKLSAKAFLATEQRIPGLGNGVLQDILYNAQIHPKKKINALAEVEKENLYKSIKETLAAMAVQGGRDTEKDIFGCSGGYKTKMSKNTAGKACLLCGSNIKKENYMGGSIYYCEGCQRI